MADPDLAEELAVLERRGKLAAYAIWAVMILAAVAALGEGLEFNGTLDFEAIEPSALTGLFAIGYVLFFLAFLASVVVISLWIHRAHANLFAAGIEYLDFTPGWSIGWFFVPIANLWLPFQAMRELWHASHGARDTFTARAPGIMTAWWTAWIVGNILDNASVRMAWSENPELVHYGLAVGAVGSVLTIVAAWFLLQIVARVTEAQLGGLAARTA
jgi:hypothetical protein